MVQKRQRITEGLTLVQRKEEEADAVVVESLATYTALHFTLMLGYAKAGVAPVEPPPQAAEVFGSDSTLCVRVPLDVVLAYHERLQYCGTLLPPKKAITWLRQRDEEERQLWIEKYSRGKESLGVVIKRCFDMRAPVWEVTTDMRRGQHPHAGGR